jgi:predicted outer membrane protein
VFSAVAQETTQADRTFAREAAMGGREEIELGRIAVKNGHSDRVNSSVKG